MKQRSLISVVAAMVFLGAAATQAQEASAPGLEISGGFFRAAPMAGGNGAGFVTIHSTGPADVLLAFSTPACERPELHTHIHEDGIMKMRQVPSIEVPAGGNAVLQPGGLHLMCIGLTAKLAMGDLVPVTLEFQNAGKVEVNLPVKGPGAMN